MRIFLASWLMTSLMLCQNLSPVVDERSPRSLIQLPQEIRRDLSIRKCLVPRYRGDTGQEDRAYTHGHFRSNTSEDYAVVCHVLSQKAQDVLVYSKLGDEWKGKVIVEDIFDPSLNANRRCEVEVTTASPDLIHAYARELTPQELAVVANLHLDHDGVDVGLCEKASIVHYFTGEKWITLQGAD